MAPDVLAQETTVRNPGSSVSVKDPKLFDTSRLDRPPATAGQSPRPTQRPAARGPFSGWEFEAHTGVRGPLRRQRITPLSPGPQFTTFNGFTSRQVRSWYFGDGAAMLNANMQSSALSQRVTDLTPVLDHGEHELFGGSARSAFAPPAR
jgi:hypothetical protein